jgi:hypothetical protein
LIYSDPFEKNFVIECLIGPISLKVWKNDRDHVRAELWDVPPVQTIRRNPPRFIPRQQLGRDVRFTPESGHWLSTSGCPLWAKRRQTADPPRQE